MERIAMINTPSEVIESRFEIKRDGQTSYLAYETDGRTWISLLHTEVAAAQRGRGIAAELAQMALEYAKDNQLTVEIVCPVVFHFLVKHPEYKPLVGKRQHN
jgi:hypothetical protein